MLLAAAVLFFWWLGGHDLWAPDEPYFAEGAREMVVDGQWAVPHVNGVVTTDKPPLFFWLIAAFSLPFGQVTSFTARLPSALAALGTLALTMRLGRRFFEPRTAALAGVVLATSYMFWDKARWSQTDALLCFLIWVALSAFESFRAGDARPRRAGLLFWLAVALAVLTKGPIGLLLPVGIAVSVLLSDGGLRRWRDFAPASGPALFAAVVGAWMVLATVGGHGEYSVWGALREHFIDRGIHGLHHKRPPWYYVEALPATLMPWTGLMPGALLAAWRRRREADRFLLIAALFVVVVFSISTEKRDLYTLPAFPAFALLGAGLVAAVCGWNGRPQPGAAVDRRWVTVAQGVVGGLLAVVGIGLMAASGRIEEVPWPSTVIVAVPLAVAGCLSVAAAVRDRPLAAVLTPAAGMAAFYLIAATAIEPALEGVKSARPLAVRLREATRDSRAAGHEVLGFSLGNVPEALAFYSDGVYVRESADPGEIVRHLDREEQVFALVERHHVEVPAELASRLCIVDRELRSRRDLLLVTNRACSGAQGGEAWPGEPGDSGR